MKKIIDLKCNRIECIHHRDEVLCIKDDLEISIYYTKNSMTGKSAWLCYGYWPKEVKEQ